MNNLTDIAYGHTVRFVRTKWNPLNFLVKLHLANGEIRLLGTLMLPRVTGGTPTFAVVRSYEKHFMRKMNGYGFNYALFQYLMERFGGSKVYVRMEVRDKGQEYISTVKRMFESRIEDGDNKVLGFSSLGFEVQFFYEIGRFEADRREYLQNGNELSS